MAHFAEINEDNVVVRVLVVPDEHEDHGEKWCSDLLGGVWKQTSYNHKIRKQFAGIGFTYDADNDIFIGIQPFPSWLLDENHDWVPPVPHPSDGTYYNWDELSASWVREGSI